MTDNPSNNESALQEISETLSLETVSGDRDKLDLEARSTVVLTVPDGGSKRVSLAAGQRALVDFPLDEATIFVDGHDLVFSFDRDGDGQAESFIVLEGLADGLASQDASSLPILIVNGVEVAADQLIKLLLAQALETASGDAVNAGGGGSSYSDDFGGDAFGTLSLSSDSDRDGGVDALSRDRDWGIGTLSRDSDGGIVQAQGGFDSDGDGKRSVVSIAGVGSSNGGNIVTLSNSMLRVTDSVASKTAPGDVIVKVTGITNARIEVEGNEVQSFTLSDLNAGRVRLVATSATQAPTLAIEVTNSGGVASKLIWVNMVFDTPGKDDTPQMIDPEIPVVEGQSVVVSNAMLGVFDADTAPADVQIEISGLKNGFFANVATPKTPTTQFTLEAVNQGQIIFVHDGSESAPSARASLINSGKIPLGAQSINFSLTKVDDVPQVDDVQLEIEQGGSVVLDRSMLNVRDVDSDDALVVLTVSSVTQGEFQLEKNSNWDKVESFTLADVVAGKVRFVHDGNADAPSFSLTASDATGVSGPAVAAKITFDNPSIDDAPVVNQPELSMSEGGTLDLKSVGDSVVDVDSPDADVELQFFSITSGKIEVLRQSGTWSLYDPASDIVILKDLKSGGQQVRFVHDGSETAPGFSVSVRDGGQTWSKPVAANVTFANVDDAPEVVAGALTIHEGESKILTVGELGVSDVDSPLEEVSIKVSDVEYGHFENLDNPKTKILNFSLADVQNSKIRFVHDGSENAPIFSITAKDAGNGNYAKIVSPKITFEADENDAPSLGQPRLTVAQQGTVAINAKDLAISDDSDATKVLITISDLEYGKFTRNDNGVASDVTDFSLANVKAGLISFVHDGSANSPAFKVAVSDGENTAVAVAALINFDSTAVDDAPVVENPSMTLSEGQTLTVTKAMLDVKDFDSTDADVTITVSGLSHGRFELDSGTAGSPAWNQETSFTLADVVAGKVRFVHDGGEDAPAFSIAAADATNLAGTPKAAVIQFSADLDDAPVLNAVKLTVNDQNGDVTILSVADFTVTDIDSLPSDIVYRVDDIANGRIENQNAKGVALDEFSHADLAAGLIRLVRDIRSNPPEISFAVKNTGGDYEVAKEATIDFTKAEILDFKLDDFSINEADIHTLQKGELNIASGSSDADVKIRFSNVINGRFQSSDDIGTSINEFSLADVAQGKVQFVHNGGETAPQFKVQVKDGANDYTSPISAPVKFMANQDDPAILRNPSINAVEGTAVTLTEKMLGISDDKGDGKGNNSNAQDIKISDLLHGRLEDTSDPNNIRTLGNNDSFTLEELRDGHIRYLAENGNDLGRPTLGLTSDGVAKQVRFNIESINDAPAGVADTAKTDEDTPVVINVLDNDTDVDKDPLEVAEASANNGTVVINADGTLKYTPDANFNGNDTITYKVSDGKGGKSQNTQVAVTVKAVDDAPVVSDTPLMELQQGDTIPVTERHVGTIIDADGVGDANIAIAVTDLTGGQFERVSSLGAPIDSFTLADVKGGDIQFVANGSDAPTYSVTASHNGMSSGPFEAKIGFDGALVMLPTSFAIEEGGSLIITESHLGIVDKGLNHSKLTVNVSNVTGGEFTLHGNPVTSFTLADVEDPREVRYILLRSDQSDNNENNGVGELALLDVDGNNLIDIGTLDKTNFQYTYDVGGAYQGEEGDHLFDGKKDQTYTSGEFRKGDKWVLVDLGQSVEVADIVVSSRPGGYNDRIHHLTLLASNNANSFKTDSNGNLVKSLDDMRQDSDVYAQDLRGYTQDNLTKTYSLGVKFVADGTAAPGFDLSFTDGTNNSEPVAATIDLIPSPQIIFGDDSGAGGGAARYDANSGGNGAGGVGNNDSLKGSQAGDVIFGDGSGGGGGAYGRRENTGGLGGSAGGGDDTIDAGDGNDIIFGDGFKGNDSGSDRNGGAGGYGGGHGGGGRVGGGDGRDGVKGGSKEGREPLDSALYDKILNDVKKGPGSDKRVFDQEMGSGNDTIDAGAGDDYVMAGGGDDIIIGGQGNDNLWGNAGNDIFVYRSGDVGVDDLKDFDVGEDKIDLRALISNPHNVLGNLESYFRFTKNVAGVQLDIAPNGDGVFNGDYVIQIDNTSIGSLEDLLERVILDDQLLILEANFLIDKQMSVLNADRVRLTAMTDTPVGSDVMIKPGNILGGKFQKNVAGTWDDVSDFSLADLKAGLIAFSRTDANQAPSFNLTSSINGVDGATITPAISFDSAAVDDAPVFSEPPIFTVEEGGSVTLSANNFKVFDTDTDPADITIMVSAVTAGDFKLNGVDANSFTLADLAAGRVSFAHDGSEATPTFSTQAKDLLTTTPPIESDVRLLMVNDAPSFNTAQLSVPDNGRVTLTDKMFDIADPDTEDKDITLEIITNMGGHFELGSHPGQAVSSFSYDDVKAGRVDYVHDGKMVEPRFTFDISDGDEEDFKAGFVAVDYDGNQAAVINTVGFNVSDGGTLALTRNHFNIQDADDDANDVNIRVSNVQHGSFFKLDGATETKVTDFTLADVQKGVIHFRHDGSGHQPAFQVQVKDDESGGAYSAAINAMVTLDGHGWQSADGNYAAFVGQTEAGELVRVSRDLLGVDHFGEKAYVKISSGSYPDGGNLNAFYNRDVFESHGVERDDINILSSAKSLALVNLSFPNNDVISSPNNDVVSSYYVGGDFPVGYGTPYYFPVRFALDSGDNDAPMIFGVNLYISQGERVTLSMDNLQVIDTDHQPDQVFLRVSNVVAGQFESSSAPGVAMVEFTLADVLAGKVQFVHDGTSTAPGFSVQARDDAGDAVFGARYDASVSFDADGSDAPVANSSPGSYWAHLDDVDTPHDQVMITVQNTVAGAFRWTGEQGATDKDPEATQFTLADYKSGKVAFVRDGDYSDQLYEGSMPYAILNDDPLPNAAAQVTLSDGANTIQKDLYFGGSHSASYSGVILDLSLDQGESVVLKASDFSFSGVVMSKLASSGHNEGAEQPQDVSLTVEDVLYANFTDRAGDVLNSFTLADVMAGNVMFASDGSAQRPVVRLSVTGVDGAKLATVTSVIDVDTQNQDIPFIKSSGFYLIKGGKVVFDGDMLDVSYPDGKPENVYLKVSGMYGIFFQYQDAPGVAITDFTWQDVLDGRVEYVHRVQGGQYPRFDIQVKAGENGSYSKAHNAYMNLVVDRSDNEAASISNPAFNIGEGQVVTLTSAGLGIRDADTHPSLVAVEVKSIENGHIEVNGKEVNSFTLQQLQDGVVDFVHDGSENSPSLQIDVAGQLAGVAITFDANQNDVPLVTGLPVMIIPGGETPLTVTEDHIGQVVDSDSGDPAINIIVSNISGGQFEKVADQGVIITQFTLADVKAGSIRFVISDESTVAYQVSASNQGDASLPVAAVVEVNDKASDDAPLLNPDNFMIAAGESLTLTQALLGVVDADSDDADVLISASNVKGGSFLKAGTDVLNFSLADVKAGQVSFLSDGSVKPEFTLGASDETNLSSSLVNVTIEYTNGKLIRGDDSGEGGPAETRSGDPGHDGGGNSGTHIASDRNDVIFGDGSGGGGGTRKYSMDAYSRGGAGGGGHDQIYAKGGNDIIFGDGFDGDNSQKSRKGNGVDGGYGGGGHGNGVDGGWEDGTKSGESNLTDSSYQDYLRDVTGGQGADERVFNQAMGHGNDLLDGGAGDDYILAGGGDDIIIGGAGDDTLWGGYGADSFVYMTGDDGHDVIKDFTFTSGDTIDLKGYLDGFDVDKDDINNFIRVRDKGLGDDVLIQIDKGGKGNFVNSGLSITLEGLGTGQVTLADFINSRKFEFNDSPTVVISGFSNAGSGIDVDGSYTLVSDLSKLPSITGDFDPTTDDSAGGNIIDTRNPVYSFTNSNGEEWYLWARQDSGYHLSRLDDTNTWFLEADSNSIVNHPADVGTWMKVSGAATDSSIANSQDVSSDVDIIRSATGGAGDDTFNLYMHMHDEILTGGAGADTYVFASGDSHSYTIADFDTKEDKLDLSDLLQGYTASTSTSDLAQWLDVDDDGSDVTIKVDQDGAGNGADNTVIVLKGLGTGNFDLDSLTDDNALILS